MKILNIEKYANGQFYINSTPGVIQKSHPWILTYLFLKYPDMKELAFNSFRLGRTPAFEKTLKEAKVDLKNKNLTIEDLKKSPIEIIEH
jgi:hypothetical protein